MFGWLRRRRPGPTEPHVEADGAVQRAEEARERAEEAKRHTSSRWLEIRRVGRGVAGQGDPFAEGVEAALRVRPKGDPKGGER